MPIPRIAGTEKGEVHATTIRHEIGGRIVEETAEVSKGSFDARKIECVIWGVWDSVAGRLFLRKSPSPPAGSPGLGQWSVG
ncbi:MAG: hypothetical protein RBS80_13700 [Thermoguttaceae bacterium]|jgi:hypothetical protein|nr:hypothetical protein [Thermoguttaceae bacterium]